MYSAKLDTWPSFLGWTLFDDVILTKTCWWRGMTFYQRFILRNLLTYCWHHPNKTFCWRHSRENLLLTWHDISREIYFTKVVDIILANLFTDVILVKTSCWGGITSREFILRNLLMSYSRKLVVNAILVKLVTDIILEKHCLSMLLFTRSLPHTQTCQTLTEPWFLAKYLLKKNLANNLIFIDLVSL